MKKTLSIILIVLIICTISIALIGCRNTTYKYDNAKKYHVGGGTYAASDVTSINVAWAKGSAYIICSEDQTSVEVSEENNISDEKWVIHQYVDEKGTLWVKPYASKIKTDEIPEYEKKILTIKLPKKVYNEAYFENHGELLSIDGLECNSLETYNTGTSTKVTNAKVNTKTVMTSQGITGSVSINGAIGGEISMTSADEAYLYTSVTPTSIKMNGQKYVKAYIPEDIEGFTAAVSTVSKLECDNTVFDIAKIGEADGTTTYAYKTGKVTMELTCKDYKVPFTDKIINTITIGKYTAPEPAV